MTAATYRKVKMKTLAYKKAPLANSEHQLEVLNEGSEVRASLPRISQKLQESDLFPLLPTSVDTLQVNLGKMCNQTCQHCHVDAGPDRREIMTKETMSLCLKAIENSSITTVDLTGGAPEMNPDFRWFVEQISGLGRKTIVRCNLTILLAGKAYSDLPDFFAKHKIHVVSSLPCYSKENTDRQRGDGVFDKSIRALQILNRVGYGIPGSGLILDLVYNPAGASLAPPQAGLEQDFKRELRELFDIQFNSLFAFTNLPVSRFLDYLVTSGEIDGYLSKLVDSYNPRAAAGVMCRTMISVGWDGNLYDCDFNQMLEIEVSTPSSRHIRDFDLKALSRRSIAVDQHCFGCTAGQGSGCGGQTV